jgi:hypothetical protein
VLTTTITVVTGALTGVITLAIGIAVFFHMKGQFKITRRYDKVCTNSSNCTIVLEVPEEMTGTIELRYLLTPFYQNHRRFGLSRAEAQFQGLYVGFEGMQNCEPYRSVGTTDDPSDWILPCGVFPLSIFNDSFIWDNNPSLLSSAGITFSGEREFFQNLNGRYQQGWKWLEEPGSLFSGQTDERFIVWMRQSFLPRVLKTYARCTDCKISKGTYDISVQNRYPAESFRGQKAIVLATVTLLGTKNWFSVIALVVISGLSFIVAAATLVCELVSPRALGEHPSSGRVTSANVTL